MEPVAIVSKILISEENVKKFLHEKGDDFAEEMKNIMNDSYPRGTVLIVQYVETINALVFIYWLECRNLKDMKKMPGFKTFISIAGYKDIGRSGDTLLNSVFFPK